MSERTQHRRAKEIFFELQELPAEDWPRELAQRCGGDDRLRRHVHDLLAHDRRASTPLDVPLLGDRVALSSAAAMARRAPHAATPEQIGGFRILEKIAEGGMGVVYRARQERPGRDVALKVLRSALPADESVQRFHRECEILGRLHHPGIAPIYAAGTHDLGFGEQPFLAMELVRGEPLREYIARCAPPRARRLDLFLELCAALHHAHGQGVVHRDLKPGNVLVDADGHPRIIDFGVARLLDEQPEHGALQTRTGRMLGTPQFMSPEQILGQRTDERSDVYALGLLLWELLAGAPPYRLTEASTTELVRAVCEAQPSATPLRRAGVPRDLEAIARRALEKNPRDRYPSALDLSLDVQRHRRDEPVLARSSSWNNLSKWVRRRPGRALAAAVLTGVALLGIALFAADARRHVERLGRAEMAWREGDLHRTHELLQATASWTDLFAGVDFAPHVDDLRSARGDDPVGQVLRAHIDRGPGPARLLAARHLERDGLVRRPTLARFLAHGLTAPPSSATFADALELTARVFYERPDASPEDTVASTAYRARLAAHLGHVDAEHHLLTLTALAGCGTHENSDAVLASMQAAADDTELPGPLRQERLRLSMLALQALLRRAQACGYLNDWLATGTDELLAVVARRVPRSRSSRPGTANPMVTAAQLFVTEAFARRAAGVPPSAVALEGARASSRDWIRAARGDARLRQRLLDGDFDLGAWPDVPLRGSVTTRAFELEALGLLTEHPELEAALRDQAQTVGVSPQYVDYGLRLARDEVAGRRGIYDPDADTHLGAWFDLVDSPLQRPPLERAPAPPGILAHWIVEHDRVRAVGEDVDLRWRNVRFVPDEHRTNSGYARLGTGGVSIIEFAFTVTGPEIQDDPLLQVAAGKATRLYLPHQGGAWITIALDDTQLSRHRVDSATLAGIEIPVSGARLAPGRHVLRLTLDAASTTTVRIRAASLRLP